MSVHEMRHQRPIRPLTEADTSPSIYIRTKHCQSLLLCYGAFPSQVCSPIPGMEMLHGLSPLTRPPLAHKSLPKASSDSPNLFKHSATFHIQYEPQFSHTYPDIYLLSS